MYSACFLLDINEIKGLGSFYGVFGDCCGFGGSGVVFLGD